MTTKHHCKGDLPDDGYGPAIDYCIEHEDETLWVSNGEYASRVNFCPYCGYKAVKQVAIDWENENERQN